ncbi:MAG: PLDc N-terminal domain-containing protein [Flavobacterium sp.]|nr:PLDc N-terminal domain-containing protein [Flavobacterium sp.]
MFFLQNYYYLSFVLQGICAIHCMRRGNQNKWLWIIVCLPIVGCIAYIYTEMFDKRDINKVPNVVGTVFNPSGSIKKLEANLQFTDTINNRVALADAYLNAGYTERAIDMYKSCLVGNFAENEYVNIKLIVAYAEAKRYDAIVPLGAKIYHLPQFPKSKAHTLYAMALAATGNVTQAEKEFRTRLGRFSGYESRYQYGMFLLQMNRPNEAKEQFTTLLNEAKQLSSREKRDHREWFALAKVALKNI